jgi:hypothetical protein
MDVSHSITSSARASGVAGTAERPGRGQVDDEIVVRNPLKSES